jgi:hypothetical protein
VKRKGIDVSFRLPLLVGLVRPWGSNKCCCRPRECRKAWQRERAARRQWAACCRSPCAFSLVVLLRTASTSGKPRASFPLRVDACCVVGLLSARSVIASVECVPTGEEEDLSLGHITTVWDGRLRPARAVAPSRQFSDNMLSGSILELIIFCLLALIEGMATPLIHNWGRETDNKARTLGSRLLADRLAYNLLSLLAGSHRHRRPRSPPRPASHGSLAQHMAQHCQQQGARPLSFTAHVRLISSPALNRRLYSQIKVLPTWNIPCFYWCTLA